MFIEFGAQHGFKTDMRFRGCKNSLNQIFNSDKKGKRIKWLILPLHESETD